MEEGIFRAIESECEAAARITRRIDDFLDLESLSQDHAELYQVVISSRGLIHNFTAKRGDVE